MALDVVGLPEVIYTSEGEKYLHLPGLIVTENLTGEVRYLLTDGLGSVRHATDDVGAVVYEQSYDPYGNPLYASSDAYGYTGEWWVEEIGLLHLRARWYDPASGTFLSKDPFEGSALVPQSMNGHNYVHGNPVNWVDPSGKSPLVLCPILIVADGLLPVGDTVCAVLLVTSVGGTAVSGAILIKHVLSTPGVEWNLPIECSNILYANIERTSHGEHRHSQGNRPTSEAAKDKQNPKETYIDNETGNTIYVGPNGRTHVFKGDKHHTSFKTSKQNRKDRVRKGRWTRVQ